MNQKLRLGVIGLSSGNGHPYSWSAICNGYDTEAMAPCPFPVIPQYLAEQKWPEARIPFVEVTHIWTQDSNITQAVANAALIPNRCDNAEEMIGQVDAVLLARDDGENHLEMARPFLKAGIPIFIDKPFALSLKNANEMLDLQHDPFQLFTCSSLRYAKELLLDEDDKQKLGDIFYIEAQTPKYWDTYAVHLLEPILVNVQERGKLIAVSSMLKGPIHISHVKWENLEARIGAYSAFSVPLQCTYFGSKGNVTKTFRDSFHAFKASIEDFVLGIRNEEIRIPRTETLEIVKIIELGRK